ncbi:MAG: ATP-binding cassette domain-containing protein [Nitrospiraceae bacterium]|nr:MAG: ATP-binding cassette domain-containing protein [Nitrospiraceae bacterium]
MKNTFPVFELNNINFAYPGGEHVLEKIHLNVHQNDIIVIKGESGAGKSTFLKLFNRFCDIRDGELLFHGRQLREYRIEKVRGSIIYLSQIPYLIEGSVGDNLMFPFQYKVHNARIFNRKRAQELLAYFNLDIPLQHEASNLSVGQRQRVSVIRAILLEPEVLLLDEPGSSLDEINRRNLEIKIESLSEISGITVIMATHRELSFNDRKHRLFYIQNRNLIEDFRVEHN